MITKTNKLFALTIFSFGIFYLVKYINLGDTSKILTCLCVPIIVFIPKFLKDKINDKLVFIYYFYIFILMILGCLGRFYYIYKYYDVFAHFMFGFAGSITAIYILNLFKLIDKNKIFNIIFIIALTLCLASFWEIIEYISSIIFKEDVQDVLKTGVRDTMEDIIVCLISCILFMIVYAFKSNKLENIVK